MLRAFLVGAAREYRETYDRILDDEATRARKAATAWAEEVLEDDSTVILDSETTGLSDPIDFLEIGVIDRFGETLFEGRCRPVSYVEHHEDGTPVRRGPVECSESAFNVHGISAEDLKAAPSFSQIYPELRRVLEGRRIVVYNASYDGRVWSQAVERYRLDGGEIDPDGWGCAMKAYAGYFGQYRYEKDEEGVETSTPKSFRYQRLGGSHGAVEDCRVTLRRLYEMAGREELPEALVPACRNYSETFEDVPF